MAPGNRTRGVLLPSEHGGWGLTLEPVALGLAVAPSAAGAALGITALAAFLARTPFKILAGDLRRGRRLDRTRVAASAAAGYGALLAASLAAALLWTAHPFWPPLAAALPLMGVQAAYDVRSRGRRLVPEIAGPAGIGSVATAVALAGGTSTGAALGLWLVAALRSAASVLLVRAQLRRAKGQPFRPAPVHAAAIGGAAAAAAAAAAGWVPWLGMAALAALLPFAWWSLRRRPVAAVTVGIHQTLLGAVVVALTAAGSRLGW